MEHTIILITKNKKIISNNEIDNIYFFKGNNLICCDKHLNLYEYSEVYHDYYEKL